MKNFFIDTFLSNSRLQNVNVYCFQFGLCEMNSLTFPRQVSGVGGPHVQSRCVCSTSLHLSGSPQGHRKPRLGSVGSQSDAPISRCSALLSI